MAPAKSHAECRTRWRSVDIYRTDDWGFTREDREYEWLLRVGESVGVPNPKEKGTRRGDRTIWNDRLQCCCVDECCRQRSSEVIHQNDRRRGKAAALDGDKGVRSSGWDSIRVIDWITG